jgi:hypothetical protein
MTNPQRDLPPSPYAATWANVGDPPAALSAPAVAARSRLAPARVRAGSDVADVAILSFR